ncbi:LLM class F420-dependent oxidoreductase [Mycolicibacterium komossense]|uniref:LLM class F420-dependent oxidoreductase n=1 Tax=Mycolicibacterium komossense TaxID=1779 RepID=A0ABT3CDM4_9MYCO|nr:LLM class F420-dependent oxidoreductase [Mycolicibacterium komossense]MCV7227589.1 LLM class F420-dependent oxidoreductase [Mycolicibacterium komossense]
MSHGVVLTPDRTAANIVDDAITQAKAAYDAGVRQVWLAQRVDYDAIALAGLIGAAVPGLGVGTSVVPINPRHPLIVASAAQTAQAASHGNFSLGLGLGAPSIESAAFGISVEKPVRRLREYLTVLRSIFHDGTADFHGDEVTASPDWPVDVPGGAPLPVYVAAMGPQALRVTGELADGTLPYLAGPRTLSEFIVPTISKAAAEAGRPAPRVFAMVPVVIDDDVEAAREHAASELAFYATIPSYQAVIAREGVDSVADLAAVGTADAVSRTLQTYLDAGATDVVPTVLRSNPAELQQLWQVAAGL